MLPPYIWEKQTKRIKHAGRSVKNPPGGIYDHLAKDIPLPRTEKCS
jgi:hypothetical protein